MRKYTPSILAVLVCLYFWNYALTYSEWHFIDNVNLIFHEAGHFIFSFLGMFIKIAAGSGLQVTIPALFAFYFFKKYQKISASVCLLWVGQNLLNISVYAGDAIKQNLNLLGGDGVIHDWNYLLSTTGLLKQAPVVASAIYALGMLLILGGTVGIGYFSIKSPAVNSRGS